ncbi:MAG: hypothetical protein ABEN55_15965 [Bradymonadaceae bacterium]
MTSSNTNFPPNPILLQQEDPSENDTTIKINRTTHQQTTIPKELETLPSELDATGGVRLVQPISTLVRTSVAHVRNLDFLDTNPDADRELDKISEDYFSQFDSEEF